MTTDHEESETMTATILEKCFRSHDLPRVGAMALLALSAIGCTITSDNGDAGNDGAKGDGGQSVNPEGGGTGDDSSSGDGTVTPDAGPPSIDAMVIPDGDASGNADGSTTTPPPPDYLWYVLDETAGTTVHDSTSHHFDMSVPGIAWNQGGVFDGTSACGGRALGPEFRSPPLTISAWLTAAARTDRPNGFQLQPYPPNAFSGDIPGVGGYGIGLNVWATGSALGVEAVAPCTRGPTLCVANKTQNALAADAGDGGLSCTTASSCNQGFEAGKEYLITVAIDAPVDGGTTPAAQVYVNGSLFDEDTAVIPAASSTPPIHLGCHNMASGYGTTGFFDGRIRDVRVYTRHLAATEVEQLFASGPTTQAPSPSDAGVSDASSE